MRRPLVVALVVLAVTPCLAGRLAAQFPHLPKVHLPSSKGEASAAKPVAYDDITLELTGARLDAAARGFAVEQREGPAIARGYQQRQAAYQMALREWQRRDSVRQAHQQAAQSCYTQATSGDRAQAQQGAQSMQARMNDPATRARMQDLQQRIQAAGQRQDMNTAMMLSDSLKLLMGVGDANQMMQAQMARQMQVNQQCGMDSVRAEAEAAQADTEPQPPASPRDSVFVLAARAAGVTGPQYAMMRERILGYLATDEAKLARSSWAFSQGELDALKAHRTGLSAYEQMLTTE